MPSVSYRRLQQYALAISVASIIYNGAEGGVSIGLGADAESRSLIFFGIQSGIEVISSILVVWRFRTVAKPGEERSRELNAKELRIERIASTCIAYLLILLGLATEATSIYGLIKHSEPTSSTVSLAVSASALVLMIVIWLPKRYLARALNSSAMQAEAQCSLSCIQITIVLFVGALIFKVRRGGWWVDSATSIVLGLSFAWEGIKLLRWVRSPDFDGGCCGHCKVDDRRENLEVGMEERYRDLCECCNEKEECRNSGECKCSSDASSHISKGCCVPVNGEGEKCCSHEYVSSPRKTDKADSCCGGCETNELQAGPSHGTAVDTCCEPRASSEGKPAASCLKACCSDTAQPSDGASSSKAPAALKSDKGCCTSRDNGTECCAESVKEESQQIPPILSNSSQSAEERCSCCH